MARRGRRKRTFTLTFDTAAGITASDQKTLKYLAGLLDRAEAAARQRDRKGAVRMVERAETKVVVLDMQTMSSGKPRAEDASFLAVFRRLARRYVVLAEKLGAKVDTDLEVLKKSSGGHLNAFLG